MSTFPGNQVPEFPIFSRHGDSVRNTNLVIIFHTTCELGKSMTQRKDIGLDILMHAINKLTQQLEGGKEQG